jgi:hypothetical protein
LRSPKGFGKRYFSLASIQAHSVAQALACTASRIETYALTLHRDRENEEDPPEESEATLSCLFSDTPCHCDCYFRRRTRRILRYSRSLCYAQCNCRFYSFRRTGIHPPRTVP